MQYIGCTVAAHGQFYASDTTETTPQSIRPVQVGGGGASSPTPGLLLPRCRHYYYCYCCCRTAGSNLGSEPARMTSIAENGTTGRTEKRDRAEGDDCTARVTTRLGGAAVPRALNDDRAGGGDRRRAPDAEPPSPRFA